MGNWVREDVGGHSGGQGRDAGLQRPGHHQQSQEEEAGGETGQVQARHDETPVPGDRSQ